MIHYIKPHSASLYDHHNHHHHHEDHVEISKNCSSPTEGCTEANTSKHIENEHVNYALNQDDIVNVCPVLLYQLSSANIPLRPGCINKDLLLEIDENEIKHYQQNNQDILWGNYAICYILIMMTHNNNSV